MRFWKMVKKSYELLNDVRVKISTRIFNFSWLLSRLFLCKWRKRAWVKFYFRLIKILYKRFEFVKVLLFAKWRCPELFVIIIIIIMPFPQRTMLWWWRQTLLQFSGRLTSKFFFVTQRLCGNISIDLVWKNRKWKCWCDENAVLYREIYVIAAWLFGVN